jgi:molybdopterin-synthase adenylyltransferase
VNGQASEATPRVFLYQEQVEQLWRELMATGGPGRQRRALGMNLDGGDVYHVYLSPPRAHFAGVPCAATVDLRQSLPDGPAEVPDLGPRDGTQVVVLLSLADDRIVGRAFVDREGSWVAATATFVPVRTELYTRSSGLLETDALARRSVAVVGLGSGGSTVAVALAQAGVGKLVLVDRDRLEVGNVARHACGVGDLGRLKTRAVRDLVLGKNPALDVDIRDLDIVEEPDALRGALEGTDLVIGATDGDASRFLINQVALDLDVTAVFGRVLTRATGGDVLRVRPRRGPCLACVYTKQFLEQRPREYSRAAEAREDAEAYMSESDINAKIQVGLASDIAPVANLITKIALVELSRDTGGGLETLDSDLRADFYIWANRREGTYAEWPAMEFSFAKPSILRWYGANVPRRPECEVCGMAPAAEPGFFGS